MIVESPTIRERDFKNLDAALDFARFAEPDWLCIERIGADLAVKIKYQGSKGDI